jgi:hypothetical protein
MKVFVVLGLNPNQKHMLKFVELSRITQSGEEKITINIDQIVAILPNVKNSSILILSESIFNSDDTRVFVKDDYETVKTEIGFRIQERGA